MNQSEELVFPGDFLGNLNEFESGLGTYVDGDSLRSSLVGKVTMEQSSSNPKIIKNVLGNFQPATLSVINVGDNILCRVLKMNYNQAFVDILTVGDTLLQISTKGIIRREDIRATEVDKVVVHDFFKSGDIVRASVISLGDNKQYYLSTAEKNLGVVKSEQ